MPVFRPWLSSLTKKTVRRTAVRPQLVCLEDRTTPSTVDILTDVVDAADGKTSLREAVALFNTAPDDTGNNTISFNESLNGKTIVLTAGELAVTGKAGATNKELTLNSTFSKAGPVGISGNSANRLFNVSDGVGLTLGEFKLTAGKADKGGAVLNAGTLKLSGTTLDGNEAADGGGVFNAATGKLVVIGSTFSNNKATTGNGGGILDFGGAAFDVTGSTFRGNTAGGLGGAIITSNLNLSNSTLSGNTSTGEGGGLWVNGQLVSVHNTIVLNKSAAQGGGLFVDAAGPGVAKLSNTLIGGNTGGDIVGVVDAGSKNNFVADPATAGGLVNAAGGNILGNGAGALLALDKVVTVTLAANTGSGPVTHALVVGGPAVDKGDKTLSLSPTTGQPLTTDQRVGFSTAAKSTVRVAGANADIGAFEVQNAPPGVTLPTNKITILEDDTAGFTFTGTGNTITVGDDGVGSTVYGVTLKTADATITLGSTTGLVGVAGNGSDKITFTAAQLSDVNAALATLKIVAVADKNGSVGVDVTVDDKSTGPGDAQSGFNTAAVNITPVIDPPSVTSVATAKDAAVDVLFSRNKVDGTEITHFKVTNLKGGTLSYVGPQSVANAPIPVTVGDVFFWAGSFFNLIPEPDTKLLFTPTAGFEGVASFDIQAAQGTYAQDTPGQPPLAAPVFGGAILTSTITVSTPPADVAVPTAKIGTAADVGAAANGAKTYDFTVTYTDNVQIDFSTLDGKDVRVTGPAGFNALASFVSSDVLNNGSPRTVTYRIVPPGGSWDFADSGTYTVAVEGGQVLDTSKNTVAAGTLGTFTVSLPDTTAPTAKIGTAAAVGDAAKGATAYDFTVVYTDDAALDAATFDGKDVRVTGPGGFNALASFVKADVAGNGTPRTATYRITPPGGSWDISDNGTYTVTVEAGQVLDTSKNAVAAGILGTFTAALTDTAAPTAKLAAAAGVTAAGAATYDFTVTYADDTALDAATFDGKDVRVVGPGGFNALASFVKADAAGNGTPRTATYRIVPPGGSWDNADNGTYTISVEAGQVLDTSKNAVAAGALGNFTVAVSPAVVPSKPALVGVPLYAVGSDAGGPATVQFFNPDKTARLIDPLTPFGTFTGGVRTASADFNGDGVADIVAGTGPGRATRVVVLDGATFKELFATDPFEASFTGGVYVSAGDLDGDGVADLIITPDEGGGPRVDVYAGKGFGKAASFFGIDDTNFRGGARASTGDLNGDGRADLIVVAGFGGGPRVAAFDGKSIGGTPGRVFGDFFAFEQTLRNGIFVTAGDLNGDGFADLICGGGPGGGPRVLAFSGKDLTAAGAQTQTQLANFFGGDPNSRGGIRLSVKDLDGDTRADLVVGAGAGAGSRVTSYLGKAIPTDGPPAENYSFDAVAGFTGGVFVG